MGTALYASAKVKYHRVMLHYLCEFERMPAEVRDFSMRTEYATIDLSGRNSHGNQEVDEVLEETGIKRKKEGAYVRTEKALEFSFHSTGFMDVGYQWLLDVLWRRTFYRQQRMRNFEKRLAYGASKMYIHLCGGSGATVWLGSEHRAKEKLLNVSVTPHISITLGQKTKLENMQSIARRNMQIVALRVVPEFIQRATQVELKTARKEKIDRLEFFRDAYNMNCKSEDRSKKEAAVEQKRSALVSSIWKRRAAEMKAIGEQLIESCTPEQILTRCRQRLQLISRHMDLMTIYPEAFMDSTGTTYHPSRKASFWSAVQDRIIPDHTFQLWGYPHVPSNFKLQYAVDIMNVVHMPLERIHSLTVGKHVQRCADAAVLSTLRNHGHQLTELHLRVDYPPWVVKQKTSTQSHRDHSRRPTDPSIRTDNANNGTTKFDINSTTPATATDWNARLADRKFKWALTVAVGSTAFLTAAKRIHARQLSCTVTFAGCRLAVTNAARQTAHTAVLDVFIEDVDDEPTAVLFNTDSDDIQTIRNAASFSNPSSLWAACCVDFNSVTHMEFTVLPFSLQHGEAETRVQAQMFGRHALHPVHASIYVQEANDTDYITLAALCHTMGAVPNNASVIVMSQGKNTNVTSLVRALQDRDFDVESFCRLYCITGNDFNKGSNVATCQRMLQTYSQRHSTLNSLSDSKSVSLLYYWSFLDATFGAAQPIRGIQGVRTMGEEWKRSVRELVATSTRTRKSNQLLPQDPDLDLVYRRAIRFNIELYWKCCLQDTLTDIPCGSSQGFKDKGQFLLVSEESMTDRRQLLKALNASCGCGKTITDERRCCIAKRCSCISANKQCDDRCKCKMPNCANSTLIRQTSHGADRNSEPSDDTSHTTQITNSALEVQTNANEDEGLQVGYESEKSTENSEPSYDSSVIDLMSLNGLEVEESDTDSSIGNEDEDEHAD